MAIINLDNRIWDAFPEHHQKRKSFHILTLQAIAQNMNKEREAFPSVATLSARTGLSESTIKRSIKSLTLMGKNATA